MRVGSDNPLAGHRAQRRRLARVRLPDLPVVFMTGYAGQAEEHGDFHPDEALLEPFSDQELLERIQGKLGGGVGAASLS